MIMVRHADAGDRSAWVGDDRIRPLNKRGRKQAVDLVALLAARTVEEIHTSPALRCVETVEPLAAARGLELIVREELSEEQWHQGELVVQELAGRDVVVCGHGGLEDALEGAPTWHKGGVLVVNADLRVVEAFRT